MTSPQVNNELYRTLGHCWWDDDVGEFSTIRFFVNPVRFGYFERVLEPYRSQAPGPLAVLDVGCGGGLLAEEFARAGFQVTGVDPSPESIETAKSHAAESGLTIAYETGVGERLRFEEASFDHVVCCDVLEHVDDAGRVLGEIARVLKPGGLFFYDTINRTFMSKMAVIKVMQEWPSTAFAAPNSHVWERFIKPVELCRMIEGHGLSQRELRGISACRNPFATWMNFRRRAKGQISFKELGQRLALHESDDLSVSYMGYAVKPGSARRQQ